MSTLSTDQEWLDWKAKNKKPRSNERMVTYDGKTMSIKQWSVVTGLTVDCITRRLNRGYSAERALSTGVQVNQHQ